MSVGIRSLAVEHLSPRHLIFSTFQCRTLCGSSVPFLRFRNFRRRSSVPRNTGVNLFSFFFVALRNFVLRAFCSGCTKRGEHFYYNNVCHFESAHNLQVELDTMVAKGIARSGLSVMHPAHGDTRRYRTSLRRSEKAAPSVALSGP